MYEVRIIMPLLEHQHGNGLVFGLQSLGVPRGQGNTLLLYLSTPIHLIHWPSACCQGNTLRVESRERPNSAVDSGKEVDVALVSLHQHLTKIQLEYNA